MSNWERAARKQKKTAQERQLETVQGFLLVRELMQNSVQNCFCLQAYSSFLFFFVTAEPKLPPLSPRRILIGLVIPKQTENDFDWTFSRWICANQQKVSKIYPV